MKGSLTLGEIGERRIVSEILAARYSRSTSSFGDDCARVLEAQTLTGPVVATTDPCPVPIASYLGFDDYYHWGWLLGTINLSDLAAAGAVPRAVVTSYVLPVSMRVDEFVRILDGIDECCSLYNVSVVGGNLKEGPAVSLSATAIGTCVREPVTRRGARSGDALMVLGDLGLFWAGFLAVKHSLSSLDRYRPELMSNILRPVPKVEVGVTLATAGLVSAAIDNSDGLYPSLMALCESSGVGVELDLSSCPFSEAVLRVADEFEVEPERLALGWGDWQLVATARRPDVDSIRKICRSLGVPLHLIGEVVPERGVRIRYRGEAGPLLRLESERFASDSWFGEGLEAYVSRLLHEPLVQ